MPRIKGIDDHIPLQSHEKLVEEVEQVSIGVKTELRYGGGSVLPSTPRTERLAISLFDLDRIADQAFRVKLVGGRLKPEPIWVVKDKPDEVVVEFTCDLLHAAMICDRIRSGDRAANDVPSRVWVNRGTGWVKLRDRDVLTLVEGPRTLLNPEVFPKIAARVVVEPPKLKRAF